jgi:CRP-like cAMP-binding protein
VVDEQPLERRVRELSQAVQSDPGSVARRLELAAALRDLGRATEAVELYRGVAVLYAEEGRFAQAIAVCRGILEIDPQHRETSELLATIAAKRAGRERAARRTPARQWAVSDFGDSESSPWTHEPAGTPPPEVLARVVDAILPEAADTPVDRAPLGPPQAADTQPFPRDDTSPSVAARPALAREPEPHTDADAAPKVRDTTSPDLVPRDPDPVVAQALGAPWPSPDTSHEAPPFPLLGDLPRAAFIDLIARLRVRHEPAGTLLVREGEPGDACYLIAAGRVRVVKGGVEVAQLKAGSFFGEFAVLADQRRHASVEVVDDVEILEISRQLLSELTAAHPGVARTLARFYRERLLETLVATAPFFAPLSPDERDEVSARFRPRRFGRGVPIIEEGEPGGGLYLILVGEVEVVRGPRESEVRLASLGEGSYFGEMSLLRGGVASATVRAQRTTEAVQLGPRDFYEVVSQHPVLWDQLRTEAARRELLNHSILAGEARRSGDGQTYLL